MTNEFEKQQFKVHGYDISPLISRKDAAKLINKSERQLDRMVAKNDFVPKYQIGRSVSFKLSDVLDWREKHLVAA